MRRAGLWQSLILLVVGLAGLHLISAGAVQAQAPEPTPLPLYALPDARLNRTYTSGSVTLANEGRTLVAANVFNNTVSLVSVVVPNQAVLEAEIPVGRDPRAVAVTPDNALALVTNRGDGTLGLIDFFGETYIGAIPLGGALPYGVVAGSNTRAYVSLQGSNEIVEVDLTQQAVVRRIVVPDKPTGLALWGDFLYVTHFWTGDVSLVYLPQGRVVDVVSTGVDTAATPAIELDITRGIAYLPQTRSNTQALFPTFDTTVFPIVTTLGLRELDVAVSQRIALDTADRPVNMPFALALDRFRNWLYIANSGSDDVSVIDLESGLARANIPVGSNPRGIVLNRDNTYVFVHNVLDGTLTIIETSRLEVIDVLPISNPNVPVDIILGAQFFHSAADPAVSAERWISCANCHFDGLPDGRTWLGFPDGPRNTPVLFNLLETSPYNWSGTWDEVADVELKIRSLHAGSGLIEDFLLSEPLGSPHAGASPDLDTLVAYLLALTPPPNPTDFDPAVIAAGEAVFLAQGCAECHVGPAGTNLQAFDVGTGNSPLERRGPAFDTPTLRYLWLSAPYFHNGSAATLMDVFTMPGEHQLVQTVSLVDIEALIRYLLSR